MKNKLLLYTCYVALIINVIACKKADPIAASEKDVESIFSFEGSINGESVNIQSAVDGYYVLPSSPTDENNVVNYTSEFKKESCKGLECSSSLRISIKENRTTNDINSSIDSTLHLGHFTFNSPNGTSSQYTQSFVGGSYSSISPIRTWDFGDGTPPVVTSHTAISHLYKHPGIYDVSLTVTDTSNCIASIDNKIKVGGTGHEFIGQYTPTILGDTALFIPYDINGIAPYTYYWDFGDGQFSTLEAPIHKYSSPGIYLSSLVVTDAKGYQSTYNQNVQINNALGCEPYITPTTQTSSPNPLNLNNVTIEWTDENGIVWTSNGIQPIQSIFKVISIEEYISTEHGEPTKKVTAIASCTLYSGENSIELTEASVVFAVSY